MKVFELTNVIRGKKTLKDYRFLKKTFAVDIFKKKSYN